MLFVCVFVCLCVCLWHRLVFVHKRIIDNRVWCGWLRTAVIVSAGGGPWFALNKPRRQNRDRWESACKSGRQLCAERNAHTSNMCAHVGQHYSYLNIMRTLKLPQCMGARTILWKYFRARDKIAPESWSCSRCSKMRSRLCGYSSMYTNSYLTTTVNTHKKRVHKFHSRQYNICLGLRCETCCLRLTPTPPAERNAKHYPCLTRCCSRTFDVICMPSFTQEKGVCVSSKGRFNAVEVKLLKIHKWVIECYFDNEDLL